MRDRSRKPPASLTRIVSTLGTSSEPLRDNSSSIRLYFDANFRYFSEAKNISRRRCHREQEQRHAPVRESGNVSLQPVADAPPSTKGKVLSFVVSRWSRRVFSSHRLRILGMFQSSDVKKAMMACVRQSCCRSRRSSLWSILRDCTILLDIDV